MVQEHLVLVSSSAEHFLTWVESKFVPHHLSVDKIASVAFNTDAQTMSVVFDTTGKVRNHESLLTSLFLSFSV